MPVDDNSHIPEFVTQEYSSAGITVRTMKFSAEDEEKMSKMSLDEMFEYKAKLIEDGKYTYEEEK